jgi:ribokinase
LNPTVTVVGSIHMDFYIHLPKLPKEDETVIGYEFKMHPGGKGANQAVAAARLGAKVFFVGRVGNDFIGPMLLENLRSNNVDVSYVTVDQSTHTGVAFILLNSRGENMIAVAPGTDSRVSTEDVDRATQAIRASQALLLQLEIPIETVVYAARRAWESGAVVVLNPAVSR